MLIRAPFVSAKSAIAAKIFVETPSGPWSTTSSSGPSESASVPVGTAIEAMTVTSR